MTASTFPSSVFPAPAGPSASNGFPRLNARNSAVSTRGVVMYRARRSPSRTSSSVTFIRRSHGTRPHPRQASRSVDAWNTQSIEEAVGTFAGLDPLGERRELVDEPRDVDAVRLGAVVLEQNERLRHELYGPARRAAPGAQVKAARELHERLQEGAHLGCRLAPRLLPHLLRGQVASGVEQ